MKPLAIITDIHGCYETLMALLDKLPDSREVILGGDLIDRGPRSDLVLLWAKQNGVRCVMGNHEHMMLYHHAKVRTNLYDSQHIWLYNGGGDGMPMFETKIPDDVMDWVMCLPLAIREGDLEISHTGYGVVEHKSDLALWMRHGHDCDHLPDDGVFRVFGHTQRKEPWITNNFAMIDTGCAYPKYGNLTAFLWPEKEFITQANCENKS